MSTTAQLGELQLGEAQLGSDGHSTPYIALSVSSGTGLPGAPVTVTAAIFNATSNVSFTPTISTGEAATPGVFTLGPAIPSATFTFTPAGLGVSILGGTNTGGVEGPVPLAYIVIAAGSHTAQLGVAQLGQMQLGQDHSPYVAGIAQLSVKLPVYVSSGAIGVQSEPFEIELLNPNSGDTLATATNTDVTGTWSPANVTLNDVTRKGFQRFTPTASGTAVIGATGNNNTAPAAIKPHYVVAGLQRFLSAAGNDANNGQSQLTPWRTAGKIMSDGIKRGVTYAGNGGDTFDASAIAVSDGESGIDSTRRITLTSYGTGQATFRNLDGTTSPVHVSSSGGVHVDNVKLRGKSHTPGATTQYLALFDGAGTLSDLVANNVDCQDGLAGVVFSHTAASIVNAPTITACLFSLLLWSGSFLGASSQVGGVYPYKNAVVQGNTYDGIDGNNTAISSGQAIAAFIIDTDTGDFTGNLLKNISATTTTGGGALVIAHSRNVRGWANEVDTVSGPAGQDAGGLNCDWSSRSCSLKYNYIKRCQGAALMAFEFQFGAGGRLADAPAWLNNEYAYNILQDNATSHFGSIGLFGDALDGLHLHHNTVITNAGGGNYHIFFSDSTVPASNVRSMHVIDNIFLSNTNTVKLTNFPAAAGTNANQTWLSNIYYSMDAGAITVQWRGSTYASIALWAAGALQDASAITADPQLTDPFTVIALDDPTAIATLTGFTPTSDAAPGVDSGVDLTAPPWNYINQDRDVLGHSSRDGTGFDIGAVELVQSGAGGSIKSRLAGDSILLGGLVS
jgi:hypothetical protein